MPGPALPSSRMVKLSLIHVVYHAWRRVLALPPPLLQRQEDKRQKGGHCPQRDKARP